MWANHQRFCSVVSFLLWPGMPEKFRNQLHFWLFFIHFQHGSQATIIFCRPYYIFTASLFRCGGVCWVEDAECGGGDGDGAKRRAVLYLLCLMTNDTLSLSSRYIVSDFLHPWEIWTLTIASFIRKLRLQRKLTKNVCALAVASLRLQFFIISRYHCACQSGQRCVFWKMALR